MGTHGAQGGAAPSAGLLGPPASGETGSDEVQRLIRATLTVAARTGSIEPSVRQILEEADLSTNAFYRHFRSKDDLLLVTYAEGTRALVERLEERMSAVDDPYERVRTWIEVFVRQASPPTARRALPWSVGMGRIAVDFPEDYERNQAAVVAPLARGIEAAAGGSPAVTPDPVRDAWLVYGYTLDTVRRHLLHGTAPDPATVEQLVTFAFRALGRPADTG
ncbi:MAG TPA: TetR/AcrR family transcriptional regulator [Acidimicrobiales bacterium]|nr:TetR/AcrR family transcriptional regulator [Acidimicrobiales bacterium]